MKEGTSYEQGTLMSGEGSSTEEKEKKNAGQDDVQENDDVAGDNTKLAVKGDVQTFGSLVASEEEGENVEKMEDGAPKENDNAEWRALVGVKTFMTDSGEVMGEDRYAVWVYKEEKHHIVRVGFDKKKLQKLYRVEKGMIFTFNTNHVEDQETTKKKKPKWNRGSREDIDNRNSGTTRDRSGRRSRL
jgi:hypothetical protein